MPSSTTKANPKTKASDTQHSSKPKLANAKKQQQHKRSLKRRLTKPGVQKGAGYQPINGTPSVDQHGGVMVDANTILYLGAIVMLAIVIYLVLQTRETQRQLFSVHNSNLNPNLTPNLTSIHSDIPNLTTNTHNHGPNRPIVNSSQLGGTHSQVAENYNRLSQWDYINRKNHERVINPLLPPERSFEGTYGIPINVPTRGTSGGYQQVGYMYKDNVISESSNIGSGNDSVIIPIFGRPTHAGGSKWNYYVSSDKFHSVKIPFTHNGRKTDDDHGTDELNDGEKVSLPAYNGQFQVNMYKYDSPKYIPYVF